MIPEILAPAGSMEALRAAVFAGADAVYLGGGRFGARAYADNFTDIALLEAIEYCHIYGVKVYLTVNTLFRDAEIKELYSYLAPLYEAGLDAVIVQDLGVMRYIYEQFPDLPIHASTQMGITTEYAYKLLKKYGVTRIVPARELSIEEIQALKHGTEVPEVEVFVQGALCYCYSGQCLMSSMLGGRSGNRGRCAQTCRLPYTLCDENGKPFVEQTGKYLLSTKDLCGLEAVPELIQAGVDSFKIEGRMKKPEYVAVCVRAYRRVVDAYAEGKFSDSLIDTCKKEMAEVFNRGGFTEGYFHQKNGKNMMSVHAPGNEGVCVGVVESVQKNKLEIRLTADVAKGDILLLKSEKEPVTLTCNADQKKKSLLTLNAPKNREENRGKKVFRVRNAILEEEIGEYAVTERQSAIEGQAEFIVGEPAKLTISRCCRGKVYRVEALGNIVEQAAKNPLTKETVQDKIGKTGNTRYYFEKLDICISENAFYPLKELKELRRNTIRQLEDTICGQARRGFTEKLPDKLTEKSLDEMRETGDHSYSGEEKSNFCKLSVLVSDEEQFDVVKQDSRIFKIYLDLQYFPKEDIIRLIQCTDRTKQLYLVLPPILRTRYLEEIDEVMKQTEDSLAGVVVRGIDELAYLYDKGYSGKVITDYSLYVMNRYSAEFIRTHFPDARITLPVELNEKQLKGLSFSDSSCEMIVYGYQQLMVSAQCIQQTAGKCSHTNPALQIRDRYNKNFFVQAVCKYCYTLYYNGIPTVLFDHIGNKSGDGMIWRLHFTKEGKSEVQNLLSSVFGNAKYEGERTRGHYNRGVE